MFVCHCLLPLFSSSSCFSFTVSLFFFSLLACSLFIPSLFASFCIQTNSVYDDWRNHRSILGAEQQNTFWVSAICCRFSCLSSLLADFSTSLFPCFASGIVFAAVAGELVPDVLSDTFDSVACKIAIACGFSFGVLLLVGLSKFVEKPVILFVAFHLVFTQSHSASVRFDLRLKRLSRRKVIQRLASLINRKDLPSLPPCLQLSPCRSTHRTLRLQRRTLVRRASTSPSSSARLLQKTAKPFRRWKKFGHCLRQVLDLGQSSAASIFPSFSLLFFKFLPVPLPVFPVHFSSLPCVLVLFFFCFS